VYVACEHWLRWHPSRRKIANSSADEAVGQVIRIIVNVGTWPVAVVKDIYTTGRNRDGPRALHSGKVKQIKDEASE